MGLLRRFHLGVLVDQLLQFPLEGLVDQVLPEDQEDQEDRVTC